MDPIVFYGYPASRFDGTPAHITIASGPVIISEDGNKILLHKSQNEKWQFIGGRLYLGESLHSNALARAKEVIENAIITILDNPPPFVIIDTIRRNDILEDILLVHFPAKIQDENQIGEARWFTIQEVEEFHNKGQTSPNILLVAKRFLSHYYGR